MEHHEEEPLIYLVDPPVGRHHKRSAVGSVCIVSNLMLESFKSLKVHSKVSFEARD